MKIAVPLEGDLVAEHFGHAPYFAIYAVNDEEVTKEIHTPPPHQPGVIPQWLHSLGVTHIISGNMGWRAMEFFKSFGIEVITGAPPAPADEVVSAFIGGTLHVEPRFCGGGHGHGHGHGCGGGGGCEH